MRIAVLGAGMVGRAIAIDLAKDFEVVSFDLSNDSLATLKKNAQPFKPFKQI
jgi:3-hydroxyacyl-CoA dehydrogenase